MKPAQTLIPQLAALALAIALLGNGCPKPEQPQAVPAKEAKMPDPQPAPANPQAKLEKATFAAGCFWGVEATFQQTAGVTATRVGYIGGRAEDPTYKLVCTGRTGHAEAVEVTYDPAKISYAQLLDVFWKGHDPTQLNRQGPDFGTQYRSAIFYHNDEQKHAAENAKRNLQRSGNYTRQRIVTQIAPARTFYPAEEYHQQYLQKRGKIVCH